MAFMVTVATEAEEAEVHEIRSGFTTSIWVRAGFARALPPLTKWWNDTVEFRNSYERFLKGGSPRGLNDVSPICRDFNGNLESGFVDPRITPKYSLEECRERDMTYDGAQGAPFA